MSLVDRLPRPSSPQAARWLELVVTCLLTAGAIAQVPQDIGGTAIGVGFVSAVVATTTVAWRRRAPATAVAVVVGAVLVYQFATSDTQMTFEPFAILLAYYAFGKVVASRSRLVLASLLGFTLFVFAATFAHLHQASAGNIASTWVAFAIVPCFGGALIARRAVMTSDLAATMLQLRAEQSLGAAAQAADERNRIARELHDVIAHCVSVMVIQAGGARLVARRDAGKARDALDVVMSCGRQALVDLRRITGAWLKDDDVGPSPGLAQVDGLVDRARSAGLSTSLEVVGRPPSIAPELDLVAYRVVQEALTNAVKYAGQSRARIAVIFAADEMELRITDDGVGIPAAGPAPASSGGHGLIGMQERVTQYGGELLAGPAPGGGWEVYARLPLVLRPAVPEQRVVNHVSDSHRPSSHRWLDLILAVSWLLILEAEVLTSRHVSGPLALNIVVVGVAALAVAVRRQHPVLFVIVVGCAGIILRDGLTSGDYATLTGIYGVLIPLYAVGAWLPRRRAVLLAAVWAAGAELVALTGGFTLSSGIGPLLAAGAAVASGMVVRSQRELIIALRETSSRLVAERVDRERLAVASERARLSRDLHVLVARGVTAMVIQAEVATNLLRCDLAEAPADKPSPAADAIASIEEAGRDVLTQLRRILGVLRHGTGGLELAPQPGLDQIHQLIEQSRDQGCPVQFWVDGNPGTLLAGLDLATYRILEDVLGDTGQLTRESLVVTLRFSDDDIVLELSTVASSARSWPSLAVRERVALFNGDVSIAAHDDNVSQMTVRLPRLTDGVMA